MSAVDGEGQPSTNTAQVLINIIRNNADPTFSATDCSVSINPNTATSTEVLTISATDADPNVLGTTNIAVWLVYCNSFILVQVSWILSYLI